VLYYLWRHEETDLKGKDGMYKTKYMDVFDEIEQKVLLYKPNSDAVEDAAQELQENGEPENAWATLASTVEQQQEEDRQEGTSLHQDYIHLDGRRTVNPQDVGFANI
jgi:hypothetical protein